MAIFVSAEPQGFGLYERSLPIFSPGETILAYIEPVGTSNKNLTDINGKPLYLINFGAEFTISSPDGTILGEQEKCTNRKYKISSYEQGDIYSLFHYPIDSVPCWGLCHYI